jgi:extracellular factor (EF) 3-hydroxypalmitic acid methyl ester biosynthesis protein
LVSKTPELNNPLQVYIEDTKENFRLNPTKIFKTKFLEETSNGKSLLTTYKKQCDEFEKLNPTIEMTIEFINFKLRTFTSKLDNHFHSIWKIYTDLNPNEKSNHVKFYHENLFPLLYVTPYTKRVYDKPLGYPGDFEMMLYLYSNEYVGESIYGKLIHKYAVNIPTAIANRTRVEYFKKQILNVLEINPSPKVLSVACGPAQELFNFWGSCKTKIPGEYTLMDFEKLGLEHIKDKITRSKFKKDKGLNTTFLLEDIKVLIKKNDSSEKVEKFDFVYAIGLADYFSDKVLIRIIKTLLSLLNNGGTLIIGNVSTGDEHRAFTELLGEWFVNHRSFSDIENLVKSLPENLTYDIEFEPITHKNIFLKIYK